MWHRSSRHLNKDDHATYRRNCVFVVPSLCLRCVFVVSSLCLAVSSLSLCLRCVFVVSSLCLRLCVFALCLRCAVSSLCVRSSGGCCASPFPSCKAFRITIALTRVEPRWLTPSVPVSQPTPINIQKPSERNQSLCSFTSQTDGSTDTLKFISHDSWSGNSSSHMKKHKNKSEKGRNSCEFIFLFTLHSILSSIMITDWILLQSFTQGSVTYDTHSRGLTCTQSVV